MSKRSEEQIDISRGYEGDNPNVNAIFIFLVVLTALIVFCFGLIWYFQYHYLEPKYQAVDKQEANPMGLSEKDKLPPEPRLQAAPGFGIQGKNGWISLELMHPQAEWEVLKKQDEELWKDGEKQGDTVVALPIEDAKTKVLESGTIQSAQDIKAKASEKAAKSFYTDSSSGREEGGTRR
ncbi:MAG: hypothetical protein ACK5NT_01285 [Pyrinomonadaceae bacterium]